MSDAQAEIARTIADNPVVLFMKGTAAQPQCGFSNMVVRILDHLGVEYQRRERPAPTPDVRQGIKDFSRLADHSAALRQRRVRRRLRHRPRDVSDRRAEDPVGRKGPGLGLGATGARPAGLVTRQIELHQHAIAQHVDRDTLADALPRQQLVHGVDRRRRRRRPASARRRQRAARLDRPARRSRRRRRARRSSTPSLSRRTSAVDSSCDLPGDAEPAARRRARRASVQE